jgi:hypothetical protein
MTGDALDMGMFPLSARGGACITSHGFVASMGPGTLPAAMSGMGEQTILTVARRMLAGFWQEAPPDDLPRIYAGDCGRMQRLLASSAVRYEPLNDEERTFAQSLIENARAGVSHARWAGTTLAAMLYFRAHRLELPLDLPRVPPWLLKDFLAWQIAPVAFFTERGESAQYARHLTSVLEVVNRGVGGAGKGDPFWTNVGMFVAQRLDCTPAYANDENLRELQHQRGVLLDWAARMSGAELEHRFAAAPAGRRRRVGIVARHLRASSETFALLPVYEHLRDHFDVVLYVAEPPPNQASAQYCVGRVNTARLLPPDLAARKRMIVADDLDVLFYGTNLGTASHDLVLLAQHRLARVQVTGVANVVTTGLTNVDYFLSGTTSDPADDAATHYTEKLFRMEGSAHCFAFPVGKGKPIARAELGLREDQPVLVSGANLYKMTPELLDAWARVLDAIPQAVLMLFPFGPHWYPSYPAEAFERHAKNVLGAERVIVMNPQPPPDRNELCDYFQLADLYLDSFPFCGSTSLMEPLEVNLPIVTRGGLTFRSAMGAAILREIDLGELIAGDEDRYVSLVCELARDPVRRKRISQTLFQRMEGKPSFLDSVGYARRIAAAFETMLAERGFA